MNSHLENEAKLYFERFVDAFSTFDGSVVAKLFTTPYLAVDATGESNVFSTTTDIADYFQSYLDSYKSDGCVSCSFHDLEEFATGSNSAVLTVSWKLLRADKTEVSSWRESYNVLRLNNEIRAYASVDHAL